MVPARDRTSPAGAGARDRLGDLRRILRGLGRTIVAFSGGVDSTFVLRVAFEELGDGVGAERVRDAAVVLAPALDVLVGVGPEQVAEQPRVRHVGRAGDALDLVEGLQLRGQAPVHAEDLFVD